MLDSVRHVCHSVPGTQVGGPITRPPVFSGRRANKQPAVHGIRIITGSGELLFSNLRPAARSEPVVGVRDRPVHYEAVNLANAISCLRLKFSPAVRKMPGTWNRSCM